MSHIAELGTSKVHPLRLSTTLSVQAKQGIWLQCKSGIRIRETDYDTANDIVIETDGPVYIAHPRPATIIPATPLDEDFAIGWQRLPTELKVQVLTNNLLRYGQPVITASPPRPGENNGVVFPFHGFIHHVLLGPHFADLSKEVFYTNNIPRLKPSSTQRPGCSLLPPTVHSLFPVPQPSWYLSYPSPSVGQWVRIIAITFTIDTGSWERLHRFANGNPSFETLQRVLIQVRWQGGLMATRPNGPIQLAWLNWVDTITPGAMNPARPFVPRIVVRFVGTLSHRFGFVDLDPMTQQAVELKMTAKLKAMFEAPPPAIEELDE
jgi:hypothetical protein